MDLDTDINTDFEENSPYQEGIIPETYQRSNRSYFHEPPELDSLIHTGRLVQKFLLKQADMDKILKIIQRRVLKETYLPVTVKEVQAGYLISPYFKDLYQYLAQNKLPSTKTAICKVEMLGEKYILLPFYSNWLLHQIQKQHYWLYLKHVLTRLLHCIILVYLWGIKV